MQQQVHFDQRETASWSRNAELLLLSERAIAPETPLIELALPALPGRRLLLKDESAHPTGSLKHRLARALLLQGLRSGAVEEGTPLFDASSGNTAIAEAWFAQLLRLPYTAVIPETVSPGKQALIRQFGGECIVVPSGRCCKQEAARIAAREGGYFLDQFANAAPAVNWREHNVIAELCGQLRLQSSPNPDWFVMGAGTGGTSTCAGRYFRKTGAKTRLLVVDPEDSAFFDFHRHGCHPGSCICASRVEGIGRPVVEPSFTASVVDSMMVVPDAASYGAARWLSAKLNQPVGVSTGCNLIGAVELLATFRSRTVATLICDDGRRYAGMLDNSEWLAQQGLHTTPWECALETWHTSGEWRPPAIEFPARATA
jgi:cysteine synthase A